MDKHSRNKLDMAPNLPENKDLGESEEEVLERWLGTKKPKTREVYVSAFKKFQEFSQTTAMQLKAEIDLEFEKKLTQRGSIENRLRQFYQWATKEEKLSESLGATYVGALMSFYRTYNYRCNLSVSREFKPIRKNDKRNLKKEDVRKLYNHAKTLRDRAIILTLYQSGMDVSTLCSLKVKHVWRGIQEGEVPLAINLARRKEGVEYTTHISTDAIESVRAYLMERKAKEEELDLESPLFIKERLVKVWKGKPRLVIQKIQPHLIQKIFREIAVEAGLVTQEEITENHWNPIRPHSLRRAFADTLRVAGVNQQVIDYLQGHKLPYGGAYFGEAYNAYKGSMDQLQIFGSAEEVINLKIQSLEEKLEITREAATMQEREMMNLRLQIDGINDFLSHISPIITKAFIAKAEIEEEMNKPFKGWTKEEIRSILKRQKKKWESCS
jgi:integrase/recombinase XerD